MKEIIELLGKEGLDKEQYYKDKYRDDPNYQFLFEFSPFNQAYKVLKQQANLSENSIS